jgi:hypothetical protein
VDACSRPREAAAGGADVDEVGHAPRRPEGSLNEVGQRGADDIENAAHVDRDHLLPFLARRVGEEAWVENTCVVDDDVEPPKFADRPRDSDGDGGRHELADAALPLHDP